MQPRLAARLWPSSPRHKIRPTAAMEPPSLPMMPIQSLMHATIVGGMTITTRQMTDDGDGVGNVCDACPSIHDSCLVVNPCCIQPQRGGINGDNVSIDDLVYLVNYVLNYGPAPFCYDEANVDAIGSINILDVLILMGNIFYGIPAELPRCPQQFCVSICK